MTSENLSDCIFDFIATRTDKHKITEILRELPELFYLFWQASGLRAFQTDKPLENMKHYFFMQHFEEFYKSLCGDPKIIAVMHKIKKDIMECILQKKQFSKSYSLSVLRYLLTETKNVEVLYNYGIELLSPVTFFHLITHFSLDQQKELYAIKKSDIIKYISDCNIELALFPFLANILFYGSEEICADIFGNPHVKDYIQNRCDKGYMTTQTEKIRKFFSGSNQKGQKSLKKYIFKYMPYCTPMIEVINTFWLGLPALIIEAKATEGEIIQFKMYNKNMILSHASDIVKDIVKLLDNKKSNFPDVCYVINNFVDVLSEGCIYYRCNEFLERLHKRVQYEQSIEDNPVFQNKTMMNRLYCGICQMFSLKNDNDENEKFGEFQKAKLLLIKIPQVLSVITPYCDTMQSPTLTNQEVFALINGIIPKEYYNQLKKIQIQFMRDYVAANPSATLPLDFFYDTLQNQKNDFRSFILYSRYIATETNLIDSYEKIEKIIDAIDTDELLGKKDDTWYCTAFLLDIYAAAKTPLLRRLFLENMLSKLPTTFLEKIANDTNRFNSEPYSQEDKNLLQKIKENIEMRIEDRKKSAKYAFEVLINQLLYHTKSSLKSRLEGIAKLHDNTENVKKSITNILRKKSPSELKKIIRYFRSQNIIETIYVGCASNFEVLQYLCHINNKSNEIFSLKQRMRNERLIKNLLYLSLPIIVPLSLYWYCILMGKLTSQSNMVITRFLTRLLKSIL